MNTARQISTLDRDTIVAQSSPPGAGRLAVVRLSGVNSFSIVATLVDAALPRQRKIQRSTIHLPGWPAALAVDLYLQQAPASYTSEDTVEIHLSGCLPLVAEILERCQALGARLALPGEFTQRAFLSGKMDLTQAQAVGAMIHARDAEECRMAARLLIGDFSSRVRRLRESLLQLVASLELALDFSDQDVPTMTHADIITAMQGIASQLDILLSKLRIATHTHAGLHVALMGPPNVGKSTLMNRMLGRDRVVVSPLPGTTRDYVDECVIYQDTPFHLYDTAGLFECEDALTRQSVQATMALLQRLDGVILVMSADDYNEAVLQSCQDLLPPELPRILCMNKIDLVTTVPAACLDWVKVSALEHRGLDSLWRALEAWSRRHSQGSGEYLVSSRNLALLTQCRDALQTAREASQLQAGFECIALDCHAAIRSLCALTGEIVTEDILGEIFSNFCIGK